MTKGVQPEQRSEEVRATGTGQVKPVVNEFSKGVGATPTADKRSRVQTRACGCGADMRGIPFTRSGPHELFLL